MPGLHCPWRQSVYKSQLCKRTAAHPHLKLPLWTFLFRRLHLSAASMEQEASAFLQELMDTSTDSPSSAARTAQQAVLSPFLTVQADPSDSLLEALNQQQQVQDVPQQPQLHIRTRMPVQQLRPAPRAVEMSTRKQYASYVDASTGEVCWDALETSSDDSEDMYAPPGPPMGAWAAAAGAFEPFAVEEQSTEVKYLRDMYSKKVGSEGTGPMAGLSQAYACAGMRLLVCQSACAPACISTVPASLHACTQHCIAPVHAIMQPCIHAFSPS